MGATRQFLGETSYRLPLQDGRAAASAAPGRLDPRQVHRGSMAAFSDSSNTDTSSAIALTDISYSSAAESAQVSGDTWAGLSAGSGSVASSSAPSTPQRSHGSKRSTPTKSLGTPAKPGAHNRPGSARSAGSAGSKARSTPSRQPERKQGTPAKSFGTPSKPEVSPEGPGSGSSAGSSSGSSSRRRGQKPVGAEGPSSAQPPASTAHRVAIDQLLVSASPAAAAPEAAAGAVWRPDERPAPISQPPLPDTAYRAAVNQLTELEMEMKHRWASSRSRAALLDAAVARPSWRKAPVRGPSVTEQQRELAALNMQLEGMQSRVAAYRQQYDRHAARVARRTLSGVSGKWQRLQVSDLVEVLAESLVNSVSFDCCEELEKISVEEAVTKVLAAELGTL